MFSHNIAYEKAFSFSRFDPEHFLASHSGPGFELDDRHWPTAEHYYQAFKFPEGDYRERIAAAASAIEAHKLGNVWWRRKRKDFKQVRKTLMTRALYSKAVQNPLVSQALLETGEQLILETSAYEHFWGIGRDQRGENKLGKIWMDIRKKLIIDTAAATKEQILG